MKKVLFASTALVASAGIAAADTSFSASAGAGIFDVGSGLDAYNFIEVTATFSGESDNGLSFGGSISIDAGYKFDTGSFAEDGTIDTSDEVGFNDLYIMGDFGTLTFDRDGVDNLVATGTNESHDFKYEYEMSGFTFALTFDVNPGSDPGDHWSVALGYAMDPFSAALRFDDSNDYEIDLGYTISPELAALLEYVSNGNTTELTVTYDNGMISVEGSVDTDHDWSLSLGYTADGITLGASTDQDSEWEITGAYDLGGGLVLVTGVNYDEVFYLGADMSF